MPGGVRNAQTIYRLRYADPQMFRQTVDAVADHEGWPEDRRLCLLGELLSKTYLDCGERERRRMIMAYMNA